MIPPESRITRLEDKTNAFIAGEDSNPPVHASSIDEAKMWIKKFDFIETRSKLELGNILIKFYSIFYALFRHTS